ncbi:hypothetical protein LX36DRAFT_754460 [Colletotrichum falcatum]|nr:hypothetical protein LX36DRAFT_754460 [Colletotrichum falcatum]
MSVGVTGGMELVVRGEPHDGLLYFCPAFFSLPRRPSLGPGGDSKLSQRREEGAGRVGLDAGASGPRLACVLSSAPYPLGGVVVVVVLGMFVAQIVSSDDLVPCCCNGLE